VLPVEEYFPEMHDQSESTVQVLSEQVCVYMDVDPEIPELTYYRDNTQYGLVNDQGQLLPNAAGLYEETDGKTVIHIGRSQPSIRCLWWGRSLMN
jgi:hypothetical protein